MALADDVFENRDDELETNIESRPFKPSGVAALATCISNPPTQAEVEEIRDKINELLAALNV